MGQKAKLNLKCKGTVELIQKEEKRKSFNFNLYKLAAITKEQSHFLSVRLCLALLGKRSIKLDLKLSPDG